MPFHLTGLKWQSLLNSSFDRQISEKRKSYQGANIEFLRVQLIYF